MATLTSPVALAASVCILGKQSEIGIYGHLYLEVLVGRGRVDEERNGCIVFCIMLHNINSKRGTKCVAAKK